MNAPGSFLLSLAALALVGCVQAQPIDYHPPGEIPSGKGAFSGSDGEWVIVGRDADDEPQAGQSKSGAVPEKILEKAN